MDQDAKDRAAREVLRRFGPQLNWAVKSVVTSLLLPYDYYEIVRQRAETQLIIYAGLMDKTSWGDGRLAAWEETTGGIESEIQNLVVRQLRVDLQQIFIRILQANGNEREFTTYSEELVGTDNEPIDEYWEDREVDRISGESGRFNEKRILRKYPNLAHTVLDGMTQKELATEAGVSQQAIAKRITREKRQFLRDCIRYRGLTVVGDETMEELEEAYSNLEKAGL